jgi:excisionase family DNA binding protein
VTVVTTTMTLQEAADQLGTHYMTVYRYVRLGRLPARKVAGVWEVDAADVAALQEGKEQPGRTRHSVDWSGRLEGRLLEGDEAGAWGVVEAALASGTSPGEVYTDLIAPALVSVGAKWHDGSISVAHEHLATSVALRLIGRMGPRFARRGRTKGVVVVTTPPGERHAIPSLMVSDLLRGAGFQVIDLGADVPFDALEEIIASVDGIVAVCVSTTRLSADRAVRRTVKAVRRAAPDIPLFIGGASIADATHASDLGADGWAQNGPGAVDLVLGVLA